MDLYKKLLKLVQKDVKQFLIHYLDKWNHYIMKNSKVLFYQMTASLK